MSLLYGVAVSREQQLLIGACVFLLDIISDTEDNLQKAVHKSNQIITEYGLIISVQKTKSMAFKGRDPGKTKIAIDKKIIKNKFV